MRKILIVGAGQGGLQLALGLRSHNYDVTVMSARTPDEIRSGRIMSTQAMFDPTLQHERDYGLNLWEQQAPKMEGIGLSFVGPDGGRVLDWVGLLDDYAQSVDQRVKMAGWLELFEDWGGKVIYHGVTTSDVDSLIKLYDLVIIAAGKGELVQLFDRDPSRSPYSSPQRALSVMYVHGMTPRPDHDHLVARFNAIPGVGELIMIQALTLTGPCDILYFGAIPGGPLDCFEDRPGPAEHFRRFLDLMRQYLPWEYELCDNVELTDGRATLTGGYSPVVRRPIGVLPSGGRVLGLGDVVFANDPITAQGSNTASKSASSYLNSILERGEEPFDEGWMQQAFDRIWSDVQFATMWTNAMLAPPPEHVMKIFGAAQTYPEIGNRFVQGFADPSDFANWLFEPDKAEQYLASVTSRQPA